MVRSEIYPLVSFLIKSFGIVITNFWSNSRRFEEVGIGGEINFGVIIIVLMNIMISMVKKKFLLIFFV